MSEGIANTATSLFNIEKPWVLLIDALNLVRICTAHKLVSRPIRELTVSAVQQCIIQLGVCDVSHAPLIINDKVILVRKFNPQMLHFRALNVC